MKTLVYIFLVFAMSSIASSALFAAEKEEISPVISQIQATRIITLKVNGLVCGFCAQGIKKRFMALTEVQSVQVSLGKKTVIIEQKQNKILQDKVIEDAIKQSGYNLVRIER